MECQDAHNRQDGDGRAGNGNAEVLEQFWDSTGRRTRREGGGATRD
jgi:hypothetical protein